MTIANALGEMFRRELQTQMVPLQQAVQRMEGSLEALDELREVTYRLEPLISRLGSMAGVRTPSVLPAPASARGRGGAVRAAAVRGPGPGRRVRLAEGLRGCAVIGCERQSRSKGYCSAHYQKLRLLMKTNRRPAEWVDDAQPQSVQDVHLPRGRAASKALKQVAPAEAAPEPTPEAESPAKGRGRGRGKAARGKRGARKQARQAKPARQAKAKGAAKRGKRGGRK